MYNSCRAGHGKNSIITVSSLFWSLLNINRHLAVLNPKIFACGAGQGKNSITIVPSVLELLNSLFATKFDIWQC